MAAANPEPNPLQQVGVDLLGKALGYLPGVFGVQNTPSGQNNIPVKETKGEVVTKTEPPPARWYTNPWVIVAAIGGLVALALLFRK